MPGHIAAARTLITDRLAAIEAEAGKLRRALEELGKRGTATPAAPKPRRKRRVAKRRRAQAPRGQRREQLLAAIKAKPGARQAELAAEIGISSSQVSGLVAGLRKERLVVKKGGGYALKQ